MAIKRICCLALGAMVFCSVLTAPVQAQNLLNKLFHRKTASKSEGLELTAEHGPWLIMCASFVKEGKSDAEALCAELREAGLDAYMYEHEFDYTETVQGLGYQKERDGFGLEPKRMRMMNPEKVTDISVLVGHFSQAEDPKGLKTLDQIKHMFPEVLRVSEDVRSLQRMGAIREMMKIYSNVDEVKDMGPMRAAFMVPNPMLPEDYFQRESVDPMVVKMNKGDRFSLLNNPKPFTVKVATFKGDSTFNDSEIQEKTKEFNFLKRTGRGLTESRLMEAESNANYLTAQLRKQGIEAYSYHDRYQSIVCVGSFDWAVRGEGPEKIVNPEIQAIVEKFKAEIDNRIPGAAYYKTKTIQGPNGGKPIALDLIPVAVGVPRL